LFLRKLLLSRQVDVIHAHNGRTTLQAALAVRLAGCGKLIATQHLLQPTRTIRTGLRRIASNAIHRWIGRQVDQFIAISTAVRDEMLVRGDCAADRITTVLNGIADPRAEALRHRDAVRRELELTADSLLIVCAARLEMEKELGTLVKAMRRVAGERPSICVIAGTGSQRGEIQRVIDSGNVGTRVRLLGFRDDVLSLIHAADLFVLPSPAEPFGLVIVEAMALGMPVIACASGGPLEIVEHELTGLLVPPSDPPAMSAAIDRLLQSEDLRRRFGANGRARYLKYFTAGRMAEEISRVYQRVLLPAATTAGLTATSTGSL
jgi:glycosyltransferase involved in cell wall biosynthesis